MRHDPCSYTEPHGDRSTTMTPTVHRSLVISMCGIGSRPAVSGSRSADKAAPAWEMSAPIPLERCQVSLSRPVLVARSHGYLWFPNLKRLAGGELFAMFSTNLDAIVPDRKASMSWS